MKIAILSDTHGNKTYIDEIINDLKMCDMIIHAGDNFSDSKYIHKQTQVGMMAVKGNCDYDNVESDLLFEVENKKIFLTHGDRYRVKMDINTIEKKAKEVDADIVVFGHTHVPFKLEKDNILYINPGSLSLPRSVDYRSYAVLNINNETTEVELIKFK